MNSFIKYLVRVTVGSAIVIVVMLYSMGSESTGQPPLSAASSVEAPKVSPPRPKFKEIAADRAPLQKLASKRDAMRDVTFYQHKSTLNSGRNRAELYIVEWDSKLSLRFKVQYAGDDWLFVEDAWGKADGQKIFIPRSSKGWERDHDSGVWEWSDVMLSDSEISRMKQWLESAKDVTIRFEGKKYYQDMKLTKQKLDAMRSVLLAYESAVGKKYIPPTGPIPD